MSDNSIDLDRKVEEVREKAETDARLLYTLEPEWNSVKAHEAKRHAINDREDDLRRTVAEVYGLEDEVKEPESPYNSTDYDIRDVGRTMIEEFRSLF